MQIYFENHFCWTEDAYRAFHSYWLFKRPVSVVLEIFLSFIFLAILINVITLEDFATRLAMVGWGLFLVFICGVFAFTYFRAIKLNLKRGLEQNYGIPNSLVIQVTNEGIDLYGQATGGKTHIQYAHLRKIIQAKKYIFLMTEAKLVIGFGKDSFTYGNAEGFLGFLKSMGL
ncbi:MAG: hypothetical protein FWD72_05220 [Eggerthellaceae bacterium]|nr:hypothetical protein [Eggerthellaceae bacterium]